MSVPNPVADVLALLPAKVRAAIYVVAALATSLLAVATAAGVSVPAWVVVVVGLFGGGASATAHTHLRRQQ